jgi:pilus assembly protein Flp/PilA
MFARLLMILARFQKDERGASLVEYGLLVALIALVVVAALTKTGTSLSTLFNNIATNLSA